MTSVLFVCLGNICRSPLAEGVLRHRADLAGLDLMIDSAGTGGWHAGDCPDPRSIAVAGRFGIDISEQCARQLRIEDFYEFDLILGLDRDNVRNIRRLAPADATARVALYLEEALGQTKDVPDPYYGSDRDFEAVYRLCEKASAALIERWR